MITVTFFFNDTATTEIYTLSLHDALPIYIGMQRAANQAIRDGLHGYDRRHGWRGDLPNILRDNLGTPAENVRSEEHTSELQSHLNLVCRLLLEKKKKISFSLVN